MWRWVSTHADDSAVDFRELRHTLSRMRRSSPLEMILVAGILAGALDILDPIVFYWLRSRVLPIRILQSVSTGLLGRAAYTGGWGTASLGLLLHFMIATCWAAGFVLAARRWPVLRRVAVPAGLLYGGLIYVVMNFVVLPLSRFPKAPGAPPAAVLINGVLAVVLLVGLPIALVTRHADSPPAP